MAGFRHLDEQLIYQGAVISLANGRFADPEGAEFERDIVHHPGAVSVVPLLEGPDGPVVVMLRQYRAAIDETMLEIPAGKRDVADEPPELTAHRELAEEVGYGAGTMELLARFHNSPGFSDELSYTYLARDLSPVATDPQGVEEQYLEIVTVPLDDVPDMIANGELTDAKSIIALLLTLRFLGR